MVQIAIFWVCTSVTFYINTDVLEGHVSAIFFRNVSLTARLKNPEDCIVNNRSLEHWKPEKGVINRQKNFYFIRGASRK